MKPLILRPMRIFALVIAGVLAAGPALADNDRSAKHGGKEKSEQHRGAERGGDRSNGRVEARFGPREQTVIREYYVVQIKAGHCPPGLAKKNNGCLPPGQARKWAVGRPLPREVIFYELPPPVLVQIGPPPAGYRYVRVANDVLMIALGTGMVVDAIQDLGRL